MDRDTLMSGAAAVRFAGGSDALGFPGHGADDTAYGADTDALEAVQYLLGEVKMAVAGKILSRVDQDGLEAFGGGVIEGMGAESDRVPDGSRVGGPALAGARLAAEVRVQQADEAFAVQAGDDLHLGEQGCALLARGLAIDWLHFAKVFPAFVDGQRFLQDHFFLQ